MKFPGRDVLAGVTDAGLSSLATFSVGIFAVRVFEPDMLGAYALCFRGVFLAAVIPTYLLLVPMEVVAMTRPREGRLTQIGADLRLVSVPAMGSALLLTGWLAFAPDGVSRQALLALTATGVATAF